MTNTKYYVTMTDKFMSGWGLAQGRINKLVFECDNYKEAQTVAEYARSREDQSYINIRYTKPYYNSNKYFVQTKNKTDYPFWYGLDS